MSGHNHARFEVTRDQITGELSAVCTGCGELGLETPRPAHLHTVERTWSWDDGSCLELCPCGFSRLFVASQSKWSPWRRGT